MAHDTAERLQKALARLGLASRREAEEWIRAGRLTVNGQPASLGMRVRGTDQIRLDGRLVRRRPQRSEAQVFLYHRSPGDPMQTPGTSEGAASHAGTEDASSGAQDANSRRRGRGGETHGSSKARELEPDIGASTYESAGVAESAAFGPGSERSGPAPASSHGSGAALSPWRTPLKDRLPKRAGRRFIAVSPMPNVDGGLELLSSDGELAEKLQRSVRRLESEFSVRIHGELSEPQMRQIREGVLDRGTLEVQSLSSSGGESTNRWYTVQTRGASGKDIRQLFERQGAIVSRVLRTRLGPVTLDRRLSRGQFRRLNAGELESLTTAASGQPHSADPFLDQDESALRKPRKRFGKRPSSARPANKHAARRGPPPRRGRHRR